MLEILCLQSRNPVAAENKETEIHCILSSEKVLEEEIKQDKKTESHGV